MAQKFIEILYAEITIVHKDNDKKTNYQIRKSGTFSKRAKSGKIVMGIQLSFRNKSTNLLEIELLKM